MTKNSILAMLFLAMVFVGCATVVATTSLGEHPPIAPGENDPLGAIAKLNFSDPEIAMGVISYSDFQHPVNGNVTLMNHYIVVNDSGGRSSIWVYAKMPVNMTYCVGCEPMRKVSYGDCGC